MVFMHFIDVIIESAIVDIYATLNEACENICELFATRIEDSFISNITHPEAVASALVNTPADAIHVTLPIVTETLVTQKIECLKPSYSEGPDGTFPSLWKVSWLTPIHKKGSNNEAVNYRGITYLAACAKVFELLMYEPLIASAGKYISTNQHGFMPKRSTTTNLMQFVSGCYKSIDDGMQVDAIYRDIKAAFDSVSHKILLAKLDRLGLSPPLGSNLGHLLFLLYINDLCTALPDNSCVVFGTTGGVALLAAFPNSPLSSVTLW
uniref:uncharacterized protein LOC125906834 n=1 Tax=Anopheles coluzzii TaxID=1518534 RepID=UPI0020FFD013|nr:uncharacterized protein LOC125906834 [Anopheles coluzzii]